MTRPKVRPVKAWAVFESDAILFQEGCDDYDDVGETHFMPAIYYHKRDAKKRGRDYRRGTITVDKP